MGEKCQVSIYKLVPWDKKFFFFPFFLFPPRFSQLNKNPTFPTYCASGPMCSSKTKNWFQIHPRLGLWCTSVSPLASLVWFLEGTLVGTWWLAPEHLWMKQRQTRKGHRQEVVDILMVACAFVKLSPRFEVARSSRRRCSCHLQPPLQTCAVVPAKEESKSKL